MHSEDIKKTNINNPTDTGWTLEKRRAFMSLPLAERNRILEQQAEKAAQYYNEDPEITDIGGGDFVDY